VRRAFVFGTSICPAKSWRQNKAVGLLQSTKPRRVYERKIQLDELSVYRKLGALVFGAGHFSDNPVTRQLRFCPKIFLNFSKLFKHVSEILLLDRMHI
jgi:hypothetical protein